jgi:hypothetical protein
VKSGEQLTVRLTVFDDPVLGTSIGESTVTVPGKGGK